MQNGRHCGYTEIISYSPNIKDLQAGREDFQALKK